MGAFRDCKNWVLAEFGGYEPGQPLPSDDEIAEQLRISSRTVRRVMRNLANLNQVTRSPGLGTFWGSSSGTNQSIRKSQKRVAKTSLVGEFQKKIESGQWRRHEKLPGVRDLCKLYHVGPKKVGDAFATLQRQGLVERIGRKRFIGPIERSIDHKQVQVFNGNGRAFSVLWTSDPLKFCFLALEEELSRNQISVEYVSIQKLPQRLQSWQNGKALPSGVVVLRANQHLTSKYAAQLSEITKLGSPNPFGAVILGASSRVFHKSVHQMVTGSINTVLGKTLANFCDQIKARSVIIWYQRTMKGLIGVGDVPKIQKNVNARLQSGQCSIREFNSMELLSLRTKTELWAFVRDCDAVTAVEILEASERDRSEWPTIVTFENGSTALSNNLSACTVDFQRMGYSLAHCIIGTVPVSRTSRGFLRIFGRIISRGSSLERVPRNSGMREETDRLTSD